MPTTAAKYSLSEKSVSDAPYSHQALFKLLRQYKQMSNVVTVVFDGQVLRLDAPLDMLVFCLNPTNL
ncbi:MAG TPA: hypothetical protein V6D12_08405 [Candidatus Obscuribacterales bacterium]